MLRDFPSRSIKRTAIVISILLLAYFSFLYGLSLHKSASRPGQGYTLTKQERHEADSLLEGMKDEIEIIRRCNQLVCEKLKFRQRNALSKGEANCVGYAQYTSALLNHVFKDKGIPYKARPVVGYVHVFGLNVHPLAMAIVPGHYKSFFKDHDFVEITTDTGQSLYIDTSLQDLLGKIFI